MLPIIISTLEDTQEREFMARLYEEYERLFFSTALKYAPTHHDAEEIVQDSLVNLIKKVTTLKQLERCTLVAYIVSTVRNTAINHLRKAGRIKLAETDIDDQSETIDPQLSLDDLLILRERQQKLAATWLNVPEDDRMLLEGKYLLGLSDGELAELAGCKSNSVRIKLTRARRNALKVMLDKEVEWI